MKTSLFATFATAALLTAASAFAAPAARSFDHDGPRYELRPGDRDFNYGYPRGYRVSDRERARWEAEHRNDRRPDDHFDRNLTPNFDRDHRAAPNERRRWEESHNYGYDPGHRVTPQERARWEAQYRR